jgi:polyisoprenyl-teichoic acid--peptidoglycan teichoic acid transferase
MSSNGSQFRPVKPTPQPRRSKARLIAVSTTAIYSLVVLVLALVLGTRLNSWARERIVQSSVIAAFDEETSVAAAPTLAAATPAADQPGVVVPTATPAPDVTPTPAPINVLLLGTDERPDEGGPLRTDTMILLSLDPTGQSMGMLSLPRDLWVPIAGQGTTAKINTAYTLGTHNNYPGGGPQLAKDTVSSLIGRPVDYYVRVNFDGFREVIDLIGGVDINVPYTIHDEEYPTEDYGVETFHLDAGLQHLDGETALKYARTRHGDSDYSRARRQQDIIRAVANKVLNAGMIPQLISKAPQLLVSAQNTVQTDIPIPTAVEMANLVNNSSMREIRQLVLDSHYGEETYSSDGQWILLPDRAQVRVALEQFFSPAATAVAAASGGPLRVEVLNGTAQAGVAAATAELLKAQGWDVVSVGDADRKDYVQTIVINYAAPVASVQKISTDLSLEPNLATLNGLNTQSSVDLRIVVGSDLLAQLR